MDNDGPNMGWGITSAMLARGSLRIIRSNKDRFLMNESKTNVITSGQLRFGKRHNEMVSQLAL